MNSIAPLATLPPDFTASPLSIRGARAAREFEASLVGSLLESLEKTFASVPGQDSLPGADDYNYLGTRALAQAISDGGGFGIARLISQHLPVNESNEKRASDRKSVV